MFILVTSASLKTCNSVILGWLKSGYLKPLPQNLAEVSVGEASINKTLKLVSVNQTDILQNSAKNLNCQLSTKKSVNRHLKISNDAYINKKYRDGVEFDFLKIMIFPLTHALTNLGSNWR